MGSDQAEKRLKNDNRTSFPGIGLKIFLGILVLGLTLLTVYVSVVKSRYRSDLSSVNESLASLMQQNSLLKQTKIKRVEFLERQFVMDHPRRLVNGLAGFLQALERSFSPPVNLDRLTVTSGDRNLVFRLSGRVRTGERVRAEYLLDQCLNRLKMLEGIIDLERLSLNTEEAAGHPYSFQLQGSVEIE